MNADKQGRLAHLQQAVRVLHGRENLHPDLCAELERLETELAHEQRELPDDPKTLLADEARRPLLDGGDYLDEQKKRDCAEFLAYAERLAVRIGREAAAVVVEGLLVSLKAGRASLP